MTPQEMISLMRIEIESPPWNGDIQAVQATVMANRQSVRVRVVDIYEYWGRCMVTVQALQGEPFPHTNTWHQTWYSDTRNTHLAFVQDVTLVY